MTLFVLLSPFVLLLPSSDVDLEAAAGPGGPVKEGSGSGSIDYLLA